VRLAAAILFGTTMFAACQPKAEPTRVERAHIAVDPKGNITLNGEPVTQEQLDAHLKNGTGTIIIETNAAGKTTITLNGKKMTAEEFADHKRGQRQQ
jgi:hypothetical protein